MATTKVALVTGSGKRRVGWHVADALAARGYALAVHYYTSAEEAAGTAEHLQTKGVPAGAFQADLTNEAGAKALVDARGTGQSLEGWPSARNALRLPQELRSLPPKPVYARAPDAKARDAA